MPKNREISGTSSPRLHHETRSIDWSPGVYNGAEEKTELENETVGSQIALLSSSSHTDPFCRAPFDGGGRWELYRSGFYEGEGLGRVQSATLAYLTANTWSGSTRNTR